MKLKLFTAAAALVAAINTQAYVIDFTEAAWGSAISGSTATRSFGDLDVTVSGAPGDLSFNDSFYERRGCRAADADLACAGDGLGVIGSENQDEVDFGEFITVSFSEAINVTDVYLLDLFFSDEGNLDETETAVISDGETPSLAFAQDEYKVNGGFLATGYTAQGVTTLVFTSLFSFADFAVAGLEIQSSDVQVPLPGSLILFGSGLLCLGAMKRRKKAQAA